MNFSAFELNEASSLVVSVYRASLLISKSLPSSIKTKLFKRKYQEETDDFPQDFGRKWA